MIFPDVNDCNFHPPYLNEQTLVERVKHRGSVKALALSPHYVITGTTNVRMWSLQSGDNVRTVTLLDVKITAMGWRRARGARSAMCPFTDAPNHAVWVGLSDGRLLWINVESGALQDQAFVHPQAVSHVVNLAEHRQLVTVSIDGTLCVWSKPPGTGPVAKLQQDLARRTQRVLAHAAVVIALNPMHIWVGISKTIEVYQSDALIIKAKMDVGMAASLLTAGAVLHAPTDNARVVTGHDDGKLLVWDAATRTQLVAVSVATGRICSLLPLRGNDLWIGLAGGRIAVLDGTHYDLPASDPVQYRLLKEWKAHNTDTVHLTSVVDDTGATVVVSCSENGSVLMWDGDLMEDRVGRALKLCEQDYASYQPLTILVASWNVAAANPTRASAGDLERWLSGPPEAPDVVVVGLQEIVELEVKKSAKLLMRDISKGSDEPGAAKAWQAALADALANGHPDTDYVLVASRQLVGLFVAVFAKRSVGVRDVQTTVVKTGLGGLHGNKGGLGVRFLVNQSSFCFMNCHLAAGHSNVAERNADMATIVRDAEFPAVTTSRDRLAFVRGGSGAAFLGYEHAFFFGDLNYRVDMTYSYALSLLSKNDIAPLLSRDQLIKALPTTVLRGFKESALLFKPTYKYDKGTQVYDQSEKQRVPAWCDRILYNGAGIKALGYGRYEFTLSDHKPVWALFEAPVKTLDWNRAAAAETAIRRELTRGTPPPALQ